jgi:phosphate transport system ATP-binding protein
MSTEEDPRWGRTSSARPSPSREVRNPSAGSEHQLSGTDAGPRARPRIATPPPLDRPGADARPGLQVVFDLENLEVFYGAFRAVSGVTMQIYKNEIAAFIGPSGCGKTTVLRCLNRMHDVTPGARVRGGLRYHDVELYGPNVSATEVRRQIGMVFQKPNPFPKSIYDNVAFGPRSKGVRGKRELDAVVEKSLQQAALWDEVKDRLRASALSLSGGQQQRLCIARTIAVDPEVVLMDEPCSALDPVATARIEELMRELRNEFTIVIVTHNMQQAARVSDRTAFFTTGVDPKFGLRTGSLVEYDLTAKLFSNPSDERTERYITGRFG